MRSDKKRVQGRLRFVLLAAPGEPVWGVEIGDDQIARAVVSVCRA
jgi:3-dehydroquinate synthetase